jgi:tRNA A37 threonylcarbamoyltransferase TsaD
MPALLESSRGRWRVLSKSTTTFLGLVAFPARYPPLPPKVDTLSLTYRVQVIEFGHARTNMDFSFSGLLTLMQTYILLQSTKSYNVNSSTPIGL